jgi:hypothetical protein
VIQGMITTFTCAGLAMFSKSLFRFGNRRRFRRRDKRKRNPLVRLVWQLWRLVHMVFRVLITRRKVQRHSKVVRPRTIRSQNPNARKLVFDGKGWSLQQSDDKAHSAQKANGSKVVAARDLIQQQWGRLQKKTRAHKNLGHAAQTLVALDKASVSKKWVPLHPWLFRIRLFLAWLINFAIFGAALFTNLMFGVTFDEPGFRELIVAWAAGLFFTWAVIEPAEVAGLLILPKLVSARCAERMDACRNKCKDAGIYG